MPNIACDSDASEGASGPPVTECVAGTFKGWPRPGNASSGVGILDFVDLPNIVNSSVVSARVTEP
jgi:hypothetical protein